MNKPFDLEERIYLFARDCRLYVKKLPKTISNMEDGKQLVRSSGSIGANYIEANKWYQKLIKSSEIVDYEYYYRYAQTLKTVPDIEKSNYYLALFSKLNGCVDADLLTELKEYKSQVVEK